MLSYSLLKNQAGILLIADYNSLRWLHEILHDVNERSPLIEDKEGPFLGLAYDIRKAYEQQREIVRPPQGFEERGTQYGVQILWPVLLLQQRLLRVSLGYIDHSKRHQAVTYALEAVIEEGLQEDFGPGDRMIALWQRLDPANKSTLAKLDSRGAIFCSWNRHERKRHFAELLESFDAMYESLYALRASKGDTGLLSPQEFERWDGIEWPDPRW